MEILLIILSQLSIFQKSVSQIDTYTIGTISTTGTTVSLTNTTDPSACTCDLNFGVCDNYCCCDASCDSATTSTWGTANVCTSTYVEDITDLYSCDNLTDTYATIQSGILENHASSFASVMCVKAKYLPTIIRYAGAGETIPTNEISSLISTGYYFGSQITMASTETDSSASCTEYCLYSNLQGSTRKIYRPIGTQLCSETTQIYFYYNETFACDMSWTPSAVDCSGYPTQMDPSTVAASLAVYPQKSTTASTVTQPATNIIWINSNSVTGQYESSTTAPTISASLSGTTCTYTNAVTNIQYFIEVTEVTITAIKALATVSTITATAGTATSASQETKINYLTGTSTTAPLIAQNSGSPGYMEGYPMQVAYQSAAAGNLERFYNDEVGFEGISSTGECTTDTSTQYYQLPWMQNTTLSCGVPSSVLSLTSVDATSCANAVTSLNSQTMASMFRYSTSTSSYYFGIWGNSTTTSYKDWIGVDSYTQITTNTESYDSTALACKLPLIKRITIYYSWAVSDDVPQRYVQYPIHSWITMDVKAGSPMSFQVEINYVEYSPISSDLNLWQSFDEWISMYILPLQSVGSSWGRIFALNLILIGVGFFIG